jgi:hypothetical protein
MPKDLVTQEEMEEFCPLAVEQLARFIETNRDFKVMGDEIVIYALAQLISNKMFDIDLEDKDKGAVIATIISGLCDFHDIPLALHREFLNTLIEQKSSTIH